MADSHSGRTAGENVQVLVRCRPLNDRELADKQTNVVRCLDGQKQIVVQPKGSKLSSKTFYFDHVFGPDKSQRDLFQSSILPIIDEVLNGYNCTIFAYGTTGTGKTFTMEGPPGSFEPLASTATPSDRVKSQMEAGIIARSVQEIFGRLEKSNLEHGVRVSHLELYNEDLCDLLSPNSENLKLLEDPRLGVQVHNLAELPVYNPQDIFNILERSYTERRTAETSMNKHSSRSHCVFSITIHIKESTTEGEDLIKVGKLNLVDLAGSENINRSGADRDSARKQEAGNINRSLLTLGRVITALTDGQMHIPYRESKLTRLLQDSLGGRTKTCIIATISPSSGNVEETMSTLEYAFRAKNIKNRPEINQKMNKREVIKEYNVEINTLRAQLDCMRRKDGVYLPNEEYERILRESKEFAEQVTLIEETLKAKERAFDELQELFDRKSMQAERAEKKLAETEVVLDKTKEELTATTGTLMTTRVELEEQKYLVDEHVKTEDKLGAEASDVLQHLQSAIEDTQGLFAKIARKQDVDAQNENKTAEMRVQMMTDLSEAEDELKTFARGVVDAVASIENELRDSQSTQQEQVQQALKQTSTWQDEHHSQVQGLVEGVKKNAAFERRTFERLSKSANTFDAIQRSLHTQHEEARAKQWATMQQTQDEYTGELEKWASARIKAADDLLALSSAHTQKHTTNLRSMDDKVTYFTSGQSAQLVAQEKQLAAFLEAQSQQFSTFRSTFLANITQTLDSFIEEQVAETSRVLEAVRSELRGQVREADTFKEDYSKWASHEAQVAHTHASRVEDAAGEWKRAIGAQVTAYEDHEGEAKSARSLLHATASRQAELEMSKVHEHVASVSSTVEELLEAASAHEEDVSTRSEEMMDLASEKRESLSAALNEHLEHVGTNVDTLVAMLSATKEAIANYEVEAVQEVEIKKTRLESFTLHTYQPTGATPAKRQFKIPQAFSKTRPQAELLRDYRERNGEMCRERAEADMAYLQERPASPQVENTSEATLNASTGSPFNSEAILSRTGASSPLSERDIVAPKTSSGASLNTSTGIPKPTIQVINGRQVAIPPQMSASLNKTASTASQTLKKTTSVSTINKSGTTTASSAQGGATKPAAAPKKTSGIGGKKAPIIHGAPLSEVNR